MKIPTVATHHGSFHADDVFAVAMLWILHKGNIEVIRTRDKSTIDTADYAVDVGLGYSPLHGRFDHHQPGGAGSRPNGVPYASAGLVWKQFGAEICNSQSVADQIDLFIIQKVDAADCAYSGPNLDRSISAIISDFNPRWNDENTPESIHERFMQAADFAKTILIQSIIHQSGKESDKQIVLQMPVEDNGILFIEQYVPWKEAVVDMPQVKLVVFPDITSSWRVQVVQNSSSKNDHRVSLPRSWGGLNGKDLDDETGIDGCIFCHSNLFIAGHQNQDGILAMARKALSV
jgi:uncharacterized UPF0160 family protein